MNSRITEPQSSIPALATDSASTADIGQASPPRARWAGLLPRIAPSRRRYKALSTLATYLVLTLVGATMVFPLVWMVTSSFKSNTEIYINPYGLWPKAPRWANYVDAWNFAPFGRFFFNSAFVAVTVTLGRLITSSMAGYAFARMRFPGRDRLFLLYLGTLMIPDQVTIIPLYLIMRWLHWLDTFQALILPGLATAYSTFLMRQYMLGMPSELEDAARIDGANHFVVFSRVILPLCGPVLATIGILNFLGSWNSFLWPLIVTSREEMRTVSVGLAYFSSVPEEGGMPPWELLLAMATFSMIPTLVVYLLGQRYFVRGIAMSGLKG